MNRFVFLISLVLIGENLLGQEIEGSKPFAMSDAFSAAANTNDALFVNAAGMSLFPNRYNLDLSHRFVRSDGFNVTSISILDSTNPPLGAGLAFSYMWGKDYGIDKQGYRLDLGFSYPFMSKLLWGFDVKYVRLDINDRENAINAATADTGFLILITKWARASVFGQNLIYIGRDELPMKAGAGVMIGSESSFYVAEDTVMAFYRNSEKKIVQSVGANLFLAEMLSITAGYKYDQTAYSNHYLSAGLGLFSRAAGFEAAYRQSITQKNDFQILGSLKFFME